MDYDDDYCVDVDDPHEDLYEASRECSLELVRQCVEGRSRPSHVLEVALIEALSVSEHIDDIDICPPELLDFFIQCIKDANSPLPPGTKNPVPKAFAVAINLSLHSACMKLIQEFYINVNEKVKRFADDDDGPIPPLFLAVDAGNVEMIRLLMDVQSFSKLDFTAEYPHRVPANSKLDFTMEYNGMTILRKVLDSMVRPGVLKLLLDEPSVDRKGIWEIALRSRDLDGWPGDSVTVVSSLLADPPALDELKMLAATQSATFFRLLADCVHDDTVFAIVSHPEIRIPLDRDQQGCTLVHLLAISPCAFNPDAISGVVMRLEALRAVLTRKALVVDARNHNGMTALDHVLECLEHKKFLRYSYLPWNECTQLLREAGAQATPIPQQNFLIGDEVMGMRQDQCMAASEYVRTFLDKSDGVFPKCIFLEGATPDSFEYVRLIVEGKDSQLPALKEKGDDFVLEVITLANDFLFHPAQIYLAEQLLRDQSIWAGKCSLWKSELEILFKAWFDIGKCRMWSKNMWSKKVKRMFDAGDYIAAAMAYAAMMEMEQQWINGCLRR
jgi:hypothetical protein